MSEIVSANNKMLEQQKADKKAISEKQVANNDAINTVIANQQKIGWWCSSIDYETGRTKSCWIKSCCWESDSWRGKSKSIRAKAAAEAEARAAAVAEAAYKEKTS